ncbi:MAG TPA: hypothetical protein IGR64_17520 [Leptolyngbyaceae cyanobacterium M65_K2018_010]|nr:hypothetical protein [Leptolyngbyaceae cyanobacterium M65_K2018_010]
MFGAIFGLIGGIFKAIGGLIGGSKKSEFFLELDEAKTGSLPEAEVTPAAQPSPTTTAEPATVKTVANAPAPASVVPAAAPPAPPAAPVSGFATTYLTTAGTALPRRRRPGPSLSPFMDMAKQVKAR